jgi:hypothetical protein
MSLNQSRFTIINADLVLSTDKEQSNVIDIRNNIVEIVFYESINKPFIDARIVVLDDFGLRNDLSTSGTERLNIVVADGNEPLQSVIEKTFFFSKVNDVEKTNERSELLSIDLVEEHVFLNAIKSISRSYESTLEEAISDIAARDLGKTVVETEFFQNSAQGERKFVIPYMSPLEAIGWLKDRMTTRTGSPSYLCADLYSPFLYFESLDNLLQEEPINIKLPLRFTDASASADDEMEGLKIYYQIKNFQEVDADDMLSLYEEGAIGSGYTNIDASTGQAFSSHVTIREVLEDFYTVGIMPRSSHQTVFDPSLSIDGRPSDEYDALNIHQVTSSKTYGQFKSYHDEQPVIEGLNVSESRLKVKNKIIRQVLRKNVIDIEMNGALFLESRISPGRRMRILFLNSNTRGDSKDLSKTIDVKKSGDYLLTNTFHRMSNDNHRITARLVKLGDLPSDFVL